MRQTDEILKYLQQGYSLTPLEALQKFGCMRLGARVWDLHKQGHEIWKEIVKDRGKHYARYYIPRQDTQKEFGFKAEALATALS